MTVPGAAAAPGATDGVRGDDAAPAAVLRRGFRADIDGLRALAIGLVVAYHADVPGFSGGFVGVDVFFVISGYLITRNLLVESSSTGHVALADFWARRIRRLVPALALLVVAVLAAVMWVQPALEWGPAARQGRAAALYVSNLTFAAESADYFAPDVRSSPFLHTWSLAVEEQFYLLWPLVVAAVCAVVARRSRPAASRRRLLGGVFAATMVGSFALSVSQTRAGSVWAFYGLPSRAWEFAAAGLLAVAVSRPPRGGADRGDPAHPPPRRGWTGRPARSVAALCGLVLLAVATVSLDDVDPYPGVRALLPVVGTLLLVGAGEGAPVRGVPVLTPLLTFGPVQWLGRVSYSWYLWHWPAIVLTVEALDEDTTTLRCAAAVGSLVVAAAAHHLVENPLRFDRRLVASPRRTFVAGAVATAVVVGLTFAVAARGERDIAADEDLQTLEEVRAGARDFLCAHQRTTGSGIEYCEDGDITSPTSVMLIGDSHTRHWTPAFADAARQEGIRLLVRWRGRCPSPDVAVTKAGAGVEDPECLAFREDTGALIDELEPEAVVISNSNGYQMAILTDPPVTPVDAWSTAYAAQLAELRAAGIRVGAVVDTPRLPFDAVDCVSERGDPELCATSVTEVLDPKRPFMDAEAAVRSELGEVPVLDVNGLLCPGGRCPVVIDDVLVYADREHLNAAHARRLAPEVGAFLRELVG